MKQITFLVVAAILISAGQLSASAQAKSRRQVSPVQVVSDLYRQHKRRSPFFQHKNRALVDKYFTKALADLIWQDATTAGDEVGALDGDPLFNAQDMEIKKFAIHKAEYSSGTSGNKATVTVTFENFGHPNSIYFEMSRSSAGWKIWDIRYGDGSRLSVILKG